MKRNIIWLLVGILIFSLGAYQNIQYEEHSLTVAATITDIKTVDTTDADSFENEYKHTYYGEYCVDGKLYADKKLTVERTSSSSPDHYVGQTVEIKVNPDNPAKKVAEGGVFGVIGLVLIVYNGIVLIKNKKQSKNTKAD